ncbi:MAG TPA: phosphotransferase [Aliidongia sp.]|nr:phosphotransferase [Aliidongia sp.]
MIDRDRRRAEFLAGAGWGRARLVPIPGDASTRRYFRLSDRGRQAILMDGSPDKFDAKPFFKIARLLHRLDYSAPLILAADPEGGFSVLEDLGDDTFTRLLDAGHDEARLYSLATDLLADLHERFDPAAGHGVPDYSDEMLLEEVDRFALWFLPAATGQETPAELRAEFQALWREILPLARAVPASLVLRDYFPGNLLLLDRPALAACGVIDFQDAVIGPIAYDLMSLLEDARRDVSAPIREAMRQRYLDRRPGLDADAFDLAFAVLGAQRYTKIVGLFCRLDRRDGKPAYLAHLPRVWRQLTASLAHPALAPIARWMDRHVPPALRGIPPRSTP